MVLAFHCLFQGASASLGLALPLSIPVDNWRELLLAPPNL